MSDLEELRKRKEQLQLEREIAKLERSKRASAKAAGWGWGWVGALGAVGSVLFLFGLGLLTEGEVGSAVITWAFAVPALTPMVLKFKSRA